MANSTKLLCLLSVLATPLLASAQRGLEALQRQLVEKQRALSEKGDLSMQAQRKLLEEQVTAVEKFLASDAKGIETHNGRLYLVDLLIGLGDRTRAKDALAKTDAGQAPAHVLIRSAMFGRRLGLKGEPEQWIEAAIAKATDPAERLGVAKDLFTLLQEPKLGEELFAKALEAAKTPDEKARIHWFMALTNREREDVEEEAYLEALEKLAKEYPTTLHGSIAKDRLRAKDARPGSPALPLVGTDLEGKPLALADYAGKVLVVDFWASWSRPSAAVAEVLVELQGKHKDAGLEILGVSLDAEREAMTKAIGTRKLGWRQVCDGQGTQTELALRWNVAQLPALFVIGRDGNYVALHVAPLQPDERREFVRTIEKALAAGK